VAGLTTEDQYPYTAVTGKNCNFNSGMASVGVTGGAVNITVNDEVALKEALFSAGPVSIAFQVVDDFMDYTSGVYTSTTCGNQASDVNHAVLAVGYGHDEESGLDYWTVKNSWGTSWGDQGFFKIQRGVNMCGVGQCNSYPASVFDAQASKTKEFLQ
jgi:cathepsin H